MNGEITFDTVVPEDGIDHLEGCYRLELGKWNVYYFTHWVNGKIWENDLLVFPNVEWQSGVRGIEAHCPINVLLNKTFAIDLLSKTLGGVFFIETAGPNSLELK